MNSTKKDLIVKQFYYEHLLPLARSLQAQGKTFFELKPDPSCRSYYNKRKKTVMKPEDFESVDCPDFKVLEEALRKMWGSDGQDDLVKLAPHISELARDLYLKEEQDEEVSPFVYVMF